MNVLTPRKMGNSAGGSSGSGRGARVARVTRRTVHSQWDASHFKDCVCHCLQPGGRSGAGSGARRRGHIACCGGQHCRCGQGAASWASVATEAYRSATRRPNRTANIWLLTKQEQMLSLRRRSSDHCGDRCASSLRRLRLGRSSWQLLRSHRRIRRRINRRLRHRLRQRRCRRLRHRRLGRRSDRLRRRLRRCVSRWALHLLRRRRRSVCSRRHVLVSSALCTFVQLQLQSDP